MTKYYLITAELAVELRLEGCRKQTADGRYIVNGGDLSCYGAEKSVMEGKAEPVGSAMAKELIRQGEGETVGH